MELFLSFFSGLSFGPEFWAALMVIIGIDLMLSGDNAVVIAMVAGKLPVEQQRRVIVFGTIAAVAMRVVLAFFAAYLMALYGLSIAAGLYLMWVAYTLVADAHDEGVNYKQALTFWGAVGTITLADVGMSLDNVLAIAAMSHGHWLLMALGVLISIPMVVAFSVAITKLIERFPLLKWVGSGVLAWAAGGIISGDPLLKMVPDYDVSLGHMIGGVVAVVLVLGTALLRFAEREVSESCC